MASFSDLVARLIGITTFAPPPMKGPELGSATVNAARTALGDHLEPIPAIRTRWYPNDVERIHHELTQGDLTLLGQLSQWMNTDGVMRGLMDVRTSVVGFPKRFYGNADIIRVLQSKNASDRSVFDEMFPATELKLMAADGIKCGVAIGEMVPVKGRDFPVLKRHYPQHLFYLWSRNQWYYRSAVGMIPITPGVPDETTGNYWILHIPGGSLSPWNEGLWPSLGRAAITKNMSWFARISYEQKHAHPARVAKTMQGGSQEERLDILRGIVAWGLNAAFALPQGWELGLVESNGRGIEIYDRSIETCNKDIATVLCGSTVMFEGGKGFSGTDVFRIVQSDLIKGTADALAHTINTMGLPAFIAQRWGLDALNDATTFEYDCTEPKDREAETRIMTGLGTAIKALTEALAGTGLAVGVTELMARFGIPVVPVGNPGTPQLPEAAPTNATPDEPTPDVEAPIAE